MKILAKAGLVLALVFLVCALAAPRMAEAKSKTTNWVKCSNKMTASGKSRARSASARRFVMLEARTSGGRKKC
jgi:preprotein translocase subunit SecG